jgi:serine/threonine-protein kinase
MNQVVGGKYKLVKRLGEGGMSVVYQAVDTTCDRVVALKIIRPSIARRREYSREQLRLEAETLVKLHEKTDSVVDVLTAGITEDAHCLPYYVMERLEGETLRRFLHSRSSRGVVFTIEECVATALSVARALTHAHRLGVIHRDIKPENIFMATDRSGETVVKVLDFGICVRVDPDGVEHERGFTGTLPNAAPEQLEGQPPTPATDVYALGLLLYELLTLRLPHDRERPGLSAHALALQVITAPIPDILAVRLDSPGRLVRLLDRCLAYDPAERPAAHDVAKMLRDIEGALLGDAGISQARTDVSDPPPEALQRPGDASGPLPGTHVNAVADDKPVNLQATTQSAQGKSGPSQWGPKDGDQVFFRESDHPEGVAAPQPAPFLGAVVGSAGAAPPITSGKASITLEWGSAAIAPSRAMEGGRRVSAGGQTSIRAAEDKRSSTAPPDTMYVDLDASGESEARARSRVAREPGPAISRPTPEPARQDDRFRVGSLAGVAPHSQAAAAPARRPRDVRRRTWIGMAGATPLAIALIVFGAISRDRAPSSAAADGFPRTSASVAAPLRPDFTAAPTADTAERARSFALPQPAADSAPSAPSPAPARHRKPPAPHRPSAASSNTAATELPSDARDPPTAPFLYRPNDRQPSSAATATPMHAPSGGNMDPDFKLRLEPEPASRAPERSALETGDRTGDAGIADPWLSH